MGDSETVVAQSSTMMDYTSTGYPSGEYVDANSNVTDTVGVAETSPVPAGDSADATYPAGHDSNSDAGAIDPSSAQEAHVASNEETRPPLAGEEGNQPTAGGESTSMELHQTTVYDADANGVVVSDANGNSTTHDMHATTAEQQFEDGAALSAEEERLWSIVKANSLDFNSWTSLIEETEKTSQDNLLKIRKVYDAFLAEFPLCYGYWKKYADHEARFGAIDKVVEVYERAVQGVTYSVDIWLHYCGFAINTYGDPDTIRSKLCVYGGKDLVAVALHNCISDVQSLAM